MPESDVALEVQVYRSLQAKLYPRVTALDEQQHVNRIRTLFTALMCDHKKYSCKCLTDRKGRRNIANNPNPKREIDPFDVIQGYDVFLYLSNGLSHAPTLSYTSYLKEVSHPNNTLCIAFNTLNNLQKIQILTAILLN